MSNSGEEGCWVEEVEEGDDDDELDDDEKEEDFEASARARALKSARASWRVGILSTRATRATC